jgi:D-lyxose ketol-isomerase
MSSSSGVIYRVWVYLPAAAMGPFSVVVPIDHHPPSALEGQKIRLHRGASTAITTTKSHAFSAGPSDRLM